MLSNFVANFLSPELVFSGKQADFYSVKNKFFRATKVLGLFILFFFISKYCPQTKFPFNRQNIPIITENARPSRQYRRPVCAISLLIVCKWFSLS
jgi:hypothetical protein